VVGLSKNAGKTSLLNAILANAPDLEWGVFSTGTDGEEEDRVYKSPKPRVKIPAGCYFCTDTQSVESLGSRASILASRLFSGRKLWFLKAEEELETVITGPASVLDQSKVMLNMRALGASKILVDGSLDRKSIALDRLLHLSVMVLGASFGSSKEIIEEINRINLLQSIYSPNLYFGKPASGARFYSFATNKDSWHDAEGLPQKVLFNKDGAWYDTGFESLMGNLDKMQKIMQQEPDAIYVPTAYTSLMHEKLAPALIQGKTQLIVRHPFQLYLTLAELKQLHKRNLIKAFRRLFVGFYALNSTAVGKSPQDALKFRAAIRKKFPGMRVIDIMELEDVGRKK